MALLSGARRVEMGGEEGGQVAPRLGLANKGRVETTAGHGG